MGWLDRLKKWWYVKESHILDRVSYQYQTGKNQPIIIHPTKAEMQRRYLVGWMHRNVNIIMKCQIIILKRRIHAANKKQRTA